jgi:hypothetical protein
MFPIKSCIYYYVYVIISVPKQCWRARSHPKVRKGTFTRFDWLCYPAHRRTVEYHITTISW